MSIVKIEYEQNNDFKQEIPNGFGWNNDQVPTINGGYEIISLKFDPESKHNKLLIQASVHISEVNENSPRFIVALFKNRSDGEEAIASTCVPTPGDYREQILTVNLTHVLALKEKDPLEFIVKVAPHSPGQGVYINGCEENGEGKRKLGGTLHSSLVVTEFKLI